MSMRIRTSALCMVALLLGTSTILLTARGAPPPASRELCMEQITREFTDRIDEARAVVFGARLLPTGDVALTTGPVVRPSVAQRLRARPSIDGILETRGRMTSELIEPLVETHRTLRCRLAAVCLAAADAIDLGPGNSTTRVLGCEDETLPRLDACVLASSPSDPKSGTLPDSLLIRTECTDLARRTLDAEAAILRAAVGYDAGYRAAIQEYGIFAWATSSVSSRAIEPIRDLVSLLGRLHQIPCFIGQCDMPDTASLRP